jgi:endonuclease/exonuclease/phosphatase family metal-dependent hydrolase
MGKLRKFNLAALILLVSMVWGFAAAGGGAKSADAGLIKVMTFNVRTAAANDNTEGINNNWNAGRKQRAFKMIAAADPDIIGVQEAIDGAYGSQVTDLKNLPGYNWYGVGRDDGKDQGEHEGVMYRASRFTLKDQGQFWISKTPDVPGTTFATCKMSPTWDCHNPRMATWVVLLDQVTNNRYFVLNQHWALPAETQPMSAALIRQKVGELSKGLSVIMTGDLNMTDAPPDHPYGNNIYDAYDQLINGKDQKGPDPKLVDAYRGLHPRIDTDNCPPGETTYHGYHGGTFFYDYFENKEDEGHNYRIDFILASPDFEVLQAEIMRSSGGGLGISASGLGQWPSDHYPVTVVLTPSASRK